MARRRSSYRPQRRSYSRRSYRAPARRSRSRSGGQTLRLVLQQPQAMARPRAPFGTFQPTALFNPFMVPFYGTGAPGVEQGGPGVPGARMIINPVQSPANVEVPDGGGALPSKK